MANPTPTPEQLEALKVVQAAAEAGVEGKLLAVETWEKAMLNTIKAELSNVEDISVKDSLMGSEDYVIELLQYNPNQ